MHIPFFIVILFGFCFCFKKQKCEMFKIKLNKEVRTDADGYLHLIDIYNRIKKHPYDAKLAFNDCTHFDANLAAVLGSLLDELKNLSYNLWVNRPRSEQVCRCLSRNNFISAFNPELTWEDPENFIEYKRFNRNDGEIFKEYIEKQLMQKQRFPAHSHKAGELIQESIMEIFVNAASHGECNYIYSCGEYDDSKTPPSLDMTIVDRGKSIYRVVNDFLVPKGSSEKTPCEAIHWALIDGNTTKSVPGGLGLTTLLNFLKLNKGAMQIVSDKGMVEFRDGQMKDYNLDLSFDGTIVNMEFNFDDDKNYCLASEVVDRNNLL